MVGAHKQLSCSFALPANVLNTVKASLGKIPSTAHELFYNLFSSKYAGVAIDDATKGRLATALQTLLKADDSLSR